MREGDACPARAQNSVRCITAIIVIDKAVKIGSIDSVKSGFDLKAEFEKAFAKTANP
jgi:hypothetical protein